MRRVGGKCYIQGSRGRTGGVTHSPWCDPQDTCRTGKQLRASSEGTHRGDGPRQGVAQVQLRLGLQLPIQTLVNSPGEARVCLGAETRGGPLINQECSDPSPNPVLPNTWQDLDPEGQSGGEGPGVHSHSQSWFC